MKLYLWVLGNVCRVIYITVTAYMFVCVYVSIKIHIYLWIFRSESDFGISEFVLLKPVFVSVYTDSEITERLQRHIILQKVVCLGGLKHSYKRI